ncbi:glycosyltransferase [Luedemannella helvata]|uniref:Glycosyltransferase n=1 Tax=Luedemannella helvata TaxID=349315 RepID=A0ABN2KUT0_9ACTN
MSDSPRLVLVAGGSLGDALPMVGLAKRLLAAGVDVLLAAESSVELLARTERVPFASLGEIPRLDDDKPVRVRPGERTGMFLTQTRRWVIDPVARTAARLGELVRDGDVIVAHPIQLAAPLVARSRGLPWLTVSPATWLFPNDERMPLYLPRPSLGRTVNRLAWRRFGRRLDQHFLRDLARVADGLGVAAPTSVLELTASPRRTLLLTSPLFLDSRRLAPHVTATGLEACDTVRLWRGGRALDAFLDAGDPPVVFRAPPMPVPASLREVAAATCDRLGVRGVYLDIWATETGQDGSLFVERYAPLSVLATRCVAGVHYGGLGTSAMFAAAGRPAVILPAMMDQFESAGVFASLGAAVRLDWHRLTPARLAAAVTRALALTDRARALGDRLSDERGLIAAAAELAAATRLLGRVRSG